MDKKTGSISPGPRYNININILFYFILFLISHVTLLIWVQTSTKHCPDLNHDIDNEHSNNGATTAPPAPPQLNNDDDDNEGWGRVEQEKSAQTTRDASSGP